MSNDSLLRTDDSTGSKGPVEPSIEELIRSHYADLYRYAYRLTGSQTDAEDLTQQCCLIAHRKLHQLRDPNAARSWLFQILRSAFFKLCRKRRPVVEADTDWEITSVVVENDEQPFDFEHLQQRLTELPENYRVALLMYYFEEKSYEEIAIELDIPIGTVMSRLSRAKTHLRSRMRPLEATS